jgi:hypothetical protein
MAGRPNGAEPQYLDATFDAIRRQYGSVDLFLQQQLFLGIPAAPSHIAAASGIGRALARPLPLTDA